MTIKLALLKSGEEVISDIGEMVTDKQMVVGYYFANPCRAILTTPEIEVDESQSSDKILTLVDPNSKIVKKYESVIEE